MKTVSLNNQFFRFCQRNADTLFLLGFISWNLGFLLNIQGSAITALFMAILAEIGGVMNYKSYKTNRQSAASPKKSSLKSVIHQLLFPIFLIGLILFTI